MIKCERCNIEMLENAEVIGQHTFEVGAQGRSNIFVSYINGKREVKGLFGQFKIQDNYCRNKLKARVCPKCGKVELCIDIVGSDN